MVVLALLLIATWIAMLVYQPALGHTQKGYLIWYGRNGKRKYKKLYHE